MTGAKFAGSWNASTPCPPPPWPGPPCKPSLQQGTWQGCPLAVARGHGDNHGDTGMAAGTRGQPWGHGDSHGDMGMAAGDTGTSPFPWSTSVAVPSSPGPEHARWHGVSPRHSEWQLGGVTSPAIVS